MSNVIRIKSFQGSSVFFIEEAVNIFLESPACKRVISSDFFQTHDGFASIVTYELYTDITSEEFARRNRKGYSTWKKIIKY